MAINQATNITPSLSGAFSIGNGVVDALAGMTVSWQVNGPSPMTAYRVIVYQNNAASTQMYSTGKVTLDTPFYGKDALGGYIFFGFEISAATLSTAGIVNGGEYKLSITQWWGDTDAESVTQSSAAAFITRAAPSLQIGTIPTPVTSRSHTFSATYSQAQGDALNWVRWQIAGVNDTANPIYDSGNIYTSLLSCSYDGFFSSEADDMPNYSIRCQIQTVNGAEADTGWVDFTVYYAVSPLTGFVQTRCLPDTDAVEVSWPKVASIPGEAVGSYQVRAGELTLAAGASVSWDSVNGTPMHFDAPYSLLWKGRISPNSAGETNLLRLQTSNEAITLYVNGTTHRVGLRAGDADIGTGAEIAAQETEVTLILTPDMVYWRTTYKTGFLAPSESLFPSAALYPSAGTPHTEMSSEAVSYLQGVITSAELLGAQICDYLEIIDGAPDEATISAAWGIGNYVPEFTESTELLANFSKGIHGGLITADSAQVTGFTVYRQRAGQRLVRVGDFDSTVQRVLDHTIRNRQGPYKWSVYPLSGGEVLAEAIESAETNPCFWDWVLLDCTQSADGYFLVNASYRFRLNVESTVMSNNNEPAIYKNFTQYPTVMRAPQNYKSGTLTGLIGYVSYEDGRAEYRDSLTLRDAIQALSVSTGRLFLRSRKGDLLEVSIAGPITMETMDNAVSQAQTASIPWVEIADAADVSLISLYAEKGDG